MFDINKNPVRNLGVSPRPERSVYNGAVIFIGSSTGGVDALEKVIQVFPEDCPPVLITQHMPHSFLQSFANRLNARFSPDIALAKEGEVLRPGKIRIASADGGHLIVTGRGPYRCGVEPGGLISGHCPSVDVLFQSGLQISERICAALLTGMGRDGASGMLQLSKEGAETIAQDQKTSVVHGMPGAAIELGGARQVLPIDEIGKALLKQTRLINGLPK